LIQTLNRIRKLLLLTLVSVCPFAWNTLQAQQAPILLSSPANQSLNQSSTPLRSVPLDELAAKNGARQNNIAVNEPLPVETAFSLSATRLDKRVNIQFLIADGYYLYKDKISLKPLTPPSLSELVLPSGKIKFDETFAKNVETYRTKLTINPIQSSTTIDASLVIDVYSQGCADIGICYPPQLQRLTFNANNPKAVVSTLDYLPNNAAGSIIKTESTPVQASTQQPSLAAQWLNSSNLFVLVFGFIGFGLLLSFTPCVLPMVPIVSAIVLGRSSTQTPSGAQHVNSAFAGFKLSLAYVLGMCITYTLVGVLAGLAGAGFGAFLQHPALLSFFALLMLVLAGAQFGWYTLSMPQTWINALSGEQKKSSSHRYIGIIFMGALSAIMVGPCVTAPLAGALAYIAQTGNAWTGGLALFSLAFGMGIPLLLIGAGGARWLPKTGPWMNKVTYAFGIMLLCVAVWMMQSLLAAWVSTALWVFMLLLTAEMLGAFEFARHTTKLSRLAQLIGLLCLVWAAAVTWGMASGRFDVLQPLSPQTYNSASAANGNRTPTFKVIPSDALETTLASLNGKPAVLDVYADWCVSCVEFERFTFREPQVANLLEQFTLLKVDTTQNTASDQALLKRLKLFGPPAIVFYSPQGKELEGARVIGFQAAQPFSEHLKQVLSLNR
jgi:thioredoxin:protein disulfide reductase